MYTPTALREKTVKELGKLAARFQITGWRSLRKEELVRAVAKAARAKASSRKSRSKSKKPKSTSLSNKAGGSSLRSVVKKKARGRSASGSTTRRSTSKQAKPRRKSPRVAARIQRANSERQRQKDLSLSGPLGGNGSNGKGKKVGSKRRKAAARPRKDRIVLLVRDAYWLQALWELSRQSIDRAQAAMAEQWHTAVPVLRLIQLDGGSTTNTSERVVRSIEIHGGVNTWYMDVPGRPRSYRVEIGYLSSQGKFFSLARSNTVTTPRPGNGQFVENEWTDIAENCEKIYALSGGYSDEAGSEAIQELFEERLGRSMDRRSGARFGAGADKSMHQRRDFRFEVDAELVIYGSTKPHSHVTLAGTPLTLQPDGTFRARISLPNRRQVLPVVANSPDGVEQRTVVLAIERNTKVMEPLIKEANE